MPTTSAAYVRTDNESETITGSSFACTTWNVWFNDAASTATTFWSDWNNTTSATSTDIWPSWVADAEAQWVYVAPREPSAEVVEAKQKAAAILDRHLTEDQRAQLARDRFFVVRGSKGRNYRINHGRARNVVEVDAEGKAVAHLCAHPGIACPDEDTMLAQKLMLETDEDSFLAVANRSAA